MNPISTKNSLNYHSLKSKTCHNRKVLLILSYDYFLNKRDFYKLLNDYQRIYLVIKKDYLLNIDAELINDIITHFKDVEIVFNPLHEQKKQVVYDLLLRNTKVISTISLYDFCEKKLQKVYISEDIEEINETIGKLSYFGLYPRLLKKVCDLSLGLSIYILSQPLWLLSAIKIYIESPGPIFYRQKRVGIRNNEFTIIKFRSMRLDAEANGAQFSSKNDNRIFPWGKIMRATRIDELPQVFNILKGELSLIGPRPERRVFTDSFSEIIPHYDDRHKVKPGISGYAQVMYNYGSGIGDARHKLMYDLYYIKNWSLKLEFLVLIRTIWTVIAKRGV